MAAKSARDARRKEEKNAAEIAEEKRKQDVITNLRLHQDMTDSTEVQSMLRQERERMEAQREQNKAEAAVGGESKEVQLAQEQGLNKAHADTVAKITENSSMLKNGLLDSQQQRLGDYYKSLRDHNSRMAQIEANRSAQWAQATNNAIGALGGAGQVIAGAAGGPKKAPQVQSQGTQVQSNPFIDEWIKNHGAHMGQRPQVINFPWSNQYYTPTTFK